MIGNKSANNASAKSKRPGEGDQGDQIDLGLKDIRTHNRESLDALLAHVDDQCRLRCEEISGRARAEADRVRQTARDRAAELLNEVRTRERRNLDERIRVERARQQSRIRQRELAERRAMAEKGLGFVREELVQLWNSSDRARECWLERTLADARAVLATDRWQLRHPEGWSPGETAASITAHLAPNVEIDWQADPALAEGFVVGAGKAVVDATPAGLTARGDRIAGVLLALLSVNDSPTLDAVLDNEVKS